jgi:hypothetical protein
LRPAAAISLSWASFPGHPLHTEPLKAFGQPEVLEEKLSLRFIQLEKICRSYRCASRTYGGPSACSNKIAVPRERAEAAMINYLAVDLLSPEAIEIAKREYQAAVLTVERYREVVRNRGI